MSKSKHTSRIVDRVVLCKAKEAIKVNFQKNGKGGVRRKTLAKAIVGEEEIARKAGITILQLHQLEMTIAEELSRNNEVNLGWVRFYNFISSATDKNVILSQTIGTFRHCLADAAYCPVVKGQEVSKKDFDDWRKEIGKDWKKDHPKTLCVSPDVMVTCPKCGTSFRVGRQLASEK